MLTSWIPVSKNFAIKFALLNLCTSIANTDLGSLIGNIQCGNFWNFLATLILREINFGWFQKVKNCYLITWGALNFEFLEFLTFSSVKFPKVKIQSPWNCWNGSFWPSEINQNWFHVKSEWQENCQNSTMWGNNYAQCGNHRNLLPHFFEKNFVKVTFYWRSY